MITWTRSDFEDYTLVESHVYTCLDPKHFAPLLLHVGCSCFGYVVLSLDVIDFLNKVESKFLTSPLHGIRAVKIFFYFLVNQTRRLHQKFDEDRDSDGSTKI